MKASLARRLEHSTVLLISLAAPSLALGPLPLKPPVAAAPLSQSLTLRELATLARVRNQAVSRG